MPGTIRVSILELVGLPSLIQSSSMGVKVSLGKQAHETQDTGDFSFPLASLRDNLNVSIHDSEGNEIANTVVEARSIVEMGNWDDLFALKGGGHVHMKLHFILSEDEQNRIRSMRDSATRKKQGDLLKKSSSSSDLVVASGGSHAPSQDSLKTAHKAEHQYVNPAHQHVNKNSAGSDAKVFGRAHPVQKIQAISTSKSTGALDKLPVYQHVKGVIQPQDQEQQSPVEKKPRNVRKMVLAFESSPVKEALPASNKMRSRPQLSSNTTTTDIPPKAPALKKTVSVKAKAVFSNLEAAPAAPFPPGVRKERGVNEDFGEPFQESKPVLSNLETTSAPSNPEQIRKERGEIGASRDPFQEKFGQKTKQFKEFPSQSTDQTSIKDNMSKVQKLSQKTEQFKKLQIQLSDQISSMDNMSKFQEKVGKKIEQFKELQIQSTDQMSSNGILSKMQKLGLKTEKFEELQIQSTDQRSSKDSMLMQPAREESNKEAKNSIKKLRRSSSYNKSKFGWETVVQAFPSKKSSAIDICTEHKWRSKHWKSSQHRAKSKVCYEDKCYSYDGLHGWIFLDETICSCIRSDDRPFIDIPEVLPCSPDTSHGKLADDGGAPSEDRHSSVHSKELKSFSTPNNGAPRRPIGQAMKIAIMLGFGVLVLITRQRK